MHVYMLPPAPHLIIPLPTLRDGDDTATHPLCLGKSTSSHVAYHAIAEIHIPT